MKTVLAIDPGFTGALAFLDESRNLRVVDMPILQYSSKTEIDAIALVALLKHRSIDLCVIEDVHAMPHDGVASAFRFGFGTGILHGIVYSRNIPIVRIRPSVWKPAMGLDREKSTSLMRAKKEFPKQSKLFSRKKDHDRAEAALLALFAFKSFGTYSMGKNCL